GLRGRRRVVEPNAAALLLEDAIGSQHMVVKAQSLSHSLPAFSVKAAVALRVVTLEDTDSAAQIPLWCGAKARKEEANAAYEASPKGALPCRARRTRSTPS